MVLYENCLVKHTLRPASYAVGTANGIAVVNANPGKNEGFDRCLAILASGTNGASGTVDVKLQDSNDGSTWTDITGAAFAQVTTANDENIFLMDMSLVNRKAQLRAVATVGTAASVFGVVLVLYEGAVGPVTQDMTPISVANVGA
jgi:hypothetical protein